MPLVIPAKPDFERDAVASAWQDRGGDVLRLDRFWELPPSLARSEVTLYGNDTFCLVVTEKLSLDLLAPDDHLLASAPDNLLRRRVEVRHLADLNPSDFPLFVKPAIPKQFRSAVYSSRHALESECRGLPASTECLVFEVVSFLAEARASRWMASFEPAASTKAKAASTTPPNALNGSSWPSNSPGLASSTSDALAATLGFCSNSMPHGVLA